MFPICGSEEMYASFATLVTVIYIQCTLSALVAVW